MNSESFFKVHRNKLAFDISNKRNVVAILFKLGLFSSRTDDSKFVVIKWSEMGMTRGEFREACEYISNNQLATIRTTNRATSFRLIGKTIIDINNSETTTRTTSQQPAYNNKNINKNIKQEKEIYKEKVLESVTANTYQTNSEPLQSSAKVSPLLEQVTALGRSMGVELHITTGFDHIEGKFEAKMILDVAENLFAWIADNPKKKATTAYLLKFLKSEQAKKQQANQPKEGSVLARWEKQSSVVNIPVMQKLTTYSVAPIKSELTPEQLRLRSIVEQVKKLGETRGVEVTFGFSSATFQKIAYMSDEAIVEESKAMLELEIRKYSDLPASERKPLKKFTVGERHFLARADVHRLKSLENVPF